MSFNSRHMDHRSSCGERRESNEITVEYLRKRTWEQLLKEDIKADGHTRFAGDKPTLAFLRYNLNATVAGTMLGYKGENPAKSLLFRVRKNGVGDILELLQMLMKAGKMPKKCTELLRRRRRTSPEAVAIAKEIIYKSAKKYGSVENARKALGITDWDIYYWLSK